MGQENNFSYENIAVLPGTGCNGVDNPGANQTNQISQTGKMSITILPGSMLFTITAVNCR
jgi:hypothetical protein